MSSPVPATPRRRRAIGEVTVGVHVKVPPATRERLNEVATALGITSGRYIEILVARDLAISDPARRPSWVPDGVDLIKTIPLPNEHEGSAA